MKNLQNLNFEQVCSIYNKYFDLGYLGTDINNKFACIALICKVTYELKKKGQKMSCYDVILNICKDRSEIEKNTFLKSLGAICESFMFGADTFPDFGIEVKDMPKTIKNLLKNYSPF